MLVTGPTGSGKSTTLAAMLDKINSERHEHILTIEDPIEYLHPHKKCLVNQREVHSDTHSFTNALRAALREDPDVVLIGEMRDLETIEAALRIAETGHLTFATLHTNSAAQTINRIIDVFPAHQQSQIRTQLSLVLEGIVCQALLPKASGTGRCLALEIMVPNAGHPEPDPRGQDPPDLLRRCRRARRSSGCRRSTSRWPASTSRSRSPWRRPSAISSNPDELQDMINRGAGLATPQCRRPAARCVRRAR